LVQKANDMDAPTTLGRSMAPLAAAPAAGAAPGAALADEQVVARVRAGDVALFEILMRRYNQRLFRLVRPLLGDDDEAADVLQEAWVRAYEHLHQFAGRARFSTWVSKIALHEGWARARQRRRLPTLAGGTAEESVELAFTVPAATPERSTAQRELAALLGGAVARLPLPLRMVFVMREVEGLSTLETAELLTISVENAKVRLHRARAALRRDLERRLGAEAPRLYRFDGERCDRIVTGVLGRIRTAG
jgi:RNA polymerase sigma-70 factor (ECF subfamily)